RDEGGGWCTSGRAHAPVRSMAAAPSTFGPMAPGILRTAHIADMRSMRHGAGIPDGPIPEDARGTAVRSPMGRYRRAGVSFTILLATLPGFGQSEFAAGGYDVLRIE